MRDGQGMAVHIQGIIRQKMTRRILTLPNKLYKD